MYNQKYHQFTSFYNHKFGFHLNGLSSGAVAAVARLKPKVVKTLDFSVQPLKELRQQLPDTFLIGRLVVDPQDFGQLGGGYDSQRATLRGQELAERILRLEINSATNQVNGLPIINAWESLNEVLPENAIADAHKLYDEFQVSFINKMRAAGFETIAMNFGTGNGTGSQWLTLYPGTLENSKYLGFHEYDWPTLDRLHKVGLSEGNGGMWLALRYRRIMNEIRQKYGDKHVCLITECGMTQGVQGGRDIGPWATQNTVPNSNVVTPITADNYWQSLLWYNSELLKDDDVMGACLFVTGAVSPWETFEHVGTITPKLEAYQQVVTTTPKLGMYALNIDPANAKGNPTPDELRQLGVQNTRLTFKDSTIGPAPDGARLQFYRTKMEQSANAGIGTLLILTNETLPGKPAYTASDAEWDSYIERFAQRVGKIAQDVANTPSLRGQVAFQVWNEPDLMSTSPAYDPTLRPAVFGRMLKRTYDAIKAVDPTLKVVTAGLVSGNPQWLQQVVSSLGGKLWADAVAIHPYGQRPEPTWPHSSWGFGYIGDSLDSYRRATSLPLWITEIGVDTTDNQLQAEYLRRFYRTIANQYAGVVERVYWFCYSDGMVMPFGLVDSAFSQKPAYQAYQEVAAQPVQPISRYVVAYVSHNTPTTLLMSRSTAVQVTIRNTSNWTWPSAGNNPVHLGYHWYTKDGRDLPPSLWTDNRTALPYDLPAGQSVTLNVNLGVPLALGPLELRWDMVEEMKTWFAWQGASTLNVPVEIVAKASANPTPTPTMSVSASHNNVNTGTDNLSQAIDKNPATRWSTLTGQKPGMWFQIDLGALKTVSQLQLDNSASPNDYPRGYVVQVSADGKNWVVVASQAVNAQPLNVTFTPRQARYIRIEQTGTAAEWYWSIHEINVTATAQATAQASHNNVWQGEDSLAQALDGNDTTRWNSRAPQQAGMWFEIDLNETKLVQGLKLDNATAPNEYPRGYMVKVSTDRQQWLEVARNANNVKPLAESFAPQLARYVRTELIAPATEAWSINGFTVKVKELSMSATASHNNVISGTDNLLQAFDGKFESRWSSRAPQQPGMAFEIDLNKTRLVSGLRLDSARSPQEYPRGYVVKLSSDRQHWGEVANQPNNTRGLEVDFKPQLARYVRVELTKQAEAWWSIHEIVLEFSGGEMSGRASHNNALSGVDNVNNAFDGRPDTRWSSRARQRPGMWFEVDLGEARVVKGLALDNRPSPQDYPRGTMVLLSTDREHWDEATRNPAHDRPLDIEFDPQTARYIRIIQISSTWRWWSIYGVVVKG